MKLKMRKTLKKVGLFVLGIASVGAAMFSAVKIADGLSNDSKKIRLSYNVGGLDATTGKYVKDESSIYTKERFACYGLSTVLDFDATVNYQVFYYDINDHFISNTEVLTSGYTSIIPRNGAYARVEITPLDDEDGKISTLEKRKYANQLTVRVAKDAKSKVDERYTSYNGHLLEVVDGFDNCTLVENKSWSAKSNGLVTQEGSYSMDKEIVMVGKNNTLHCDFSKMTFAESENIRVTILEFSDLPTKVGVLKEKTEYFSKTSNPTHDLKLEIGCKYILVSLTSTTGANVSIHNNFSSALSLTKI